MRAKRMRTTRQQLIEEPATLADRTANGAGADTEPARELALDSALRKMVALYESQYDADVPFKRPDWLVAALSSPGHADAGKVEGGGWLPIESAPKNRAIQIFIPNADYYGNDGVYAGILVDLGTGQRWATFGWAVARDLPPHMHPSHWRPLPTPPSSEVA